MFDKSTIKARGKIEKTLKLLAFCAIIDIPFILP